MFGQKRIGFSHDLHMIPNGNIRYPVQAMIFCSFFCYSLIGKMAVVEVTMKNPPAVFISMLVFSPSFKLPIDECPQPVENTLCTNAFMVVWPSPDNRVQYPNQGFMIIGELQSCWLDVVCCSNARSIHQCGIYSVSIVYWEKFYLFLL